MGYHQKRNGRRATVSCQCQRTRPVNRSREQELRQQPGVLAGDHAVAFAAHLDEAVAIIEAWQGAAAPFVPVVPRAGEGHGATEAPRGMLYHRYVLDDAGIIQDAQIVPPTAQNQKAIEADLATFVGANLDLPRDELIRRCEMAIRTYDPCISCATHFLDLTVEHV